MAANGKQPLAESMRAVVSGEWRETRDTGYGAWGGGSEIQDGRFKIQEGGMEVRGAARDRRFKIQNPRGA